MAVGIIGIFSLGVLVGDGRFSIVPQGQLSNRTGLPRTLNYASVNQLYDTLRATYDGKLTETQILNGIKHGLASAPNDPYTEYFTPSEAKAFNNELNGIGLTGIGAELSENAKGDIIIMAPLNGSPAAAAGIKAKDIITSIDNQTTAGMSINTAVSKIRGPKGSKVTLGILRGSKELTFTITRAEIAIPTATSKILKDNIGYLQISQFSSDTYGLVQQAVTKLQHAGVKKLIVDLRDNPGGEVTSAKNIASLWLPKGAIIEREKRGSQVIATYRATGNNPLKGMPTVVLVNSGSASAAEITALALHDNHAAIIMGEQSFGKGVVQSVIPFSDGSEFKVTIAKWYSPDGTNVNHKGITPDKLVPLNVAEAKVGIDTQLQAAENYLQGK